jgi:hypothetical protein
MRLNRRHVVRLAGVTLAATSLYATTALSSPALASPIASTDPGPVPAGASWRVDLSKTAGASEHGVAHDSTGLTLSSSATSPASLDSTRREGTYTSRTYRLQRAANRVAVRAGEVTPAGTTVTVEVRGFALGRWTEWREATTTAAVLPAAADRLQVRATLSSRTAEKPRLTSLELTADRAADAAGDSSAQGATYRLYATREGLVGGTTANGHVITSRDHFVALPSRRGLNANDGTRDYQVRVCNPANGQCEVAPVWDVGPWNTKDDYWNPSSVREMWQDLPQGKPEAQAAYEDGYNGGLDMFGRRVANPAGIDLADGTFWDGLGMSDNGWVEVEFLWTAGGKGMYGGSPTDFNGDGKDDIVTFSQGSSADVYVGPSTGSSFGSAKWHDQFAPSGQTPLTGDFNGDGKDDAVAFTQDESADVWVALSDGATFGTPTVWHDFFAAAGEVPAVGDVNGDGKDDIVTFTNNAAGDVYVALSTGSGFGASAKWHDWFAPNGEFPAVGDINGDGKDDIVTFTRGSAGDVYVALSDGTSFGASVKAHDWFAPGGEQPRVGDVNGDGKDDIVTFTNDSLGDVYVALSDGTGFGAGAKWHDWFAPNGEFPYVGDFDGDGKADIVTFTKNSSADVYVALSTGSAFGAGTKWNDFFGLAGETTL